jgi:ABC-type glutathione transport system ATPase component
VFKDLAPGTYAVSAYQDLNGNQRLDANMVGMPTEPYGFSRDAKASSARPSSMTRPSSWAPSRNASSSSCRASEVGSMSTEPKTPGPLLSLRGIEREFALGETRIRALRGIDLDVAPGEFMAIWGPSGSGKSTLLNLLGLIDAADKGVLRFEGRT